MKEVVAVTVGTVEHVLCYGRHIAVQGGVGRFLSGCGNRERHGRYTRQGEGPELLDHLLFPPEGAMMRRATITAHVHNW
jgi:hypothetical protein